MVFVSLSVKVLMIKITLLDFVVRLFDNISVLSVSNRLDLLHLGPDSQLSDICDVKSDHNSQYM